MAYVYVQAFVVPYNKSLFSTDTTPHLNRENTQFQDGFNNWASSLSQISCQDGVSFARPFRTPQSIP